MGALHISVLLACAAALGCSEATMGSEPNNAGSGGLLPPDDAGTDAVMKSGEFTLLTYNVAGLPEGMSGSHPLTNTPIISPLLNAYDLVLVQESWQTPDPNPLAPFRVHHELLVAESDHPYQSVPAPHPLGLDEARPDALISDGLNRLSRFPFSDMRRVRWELCVATASDCLAFKGFSVARTTFDDGATIDVYNLHMEAGSSAEDDDARDRDIDQLLESIESYSDEQPIIVAGDFNLHTDSEPASTQFARLLGSAGLTDACVTLDCSHPAKIDKVLYRGSSTLAVEATSWQREADRFVDGEGNDLSDHEPVAVRLRWTRR